MPKYDEAVAQRISEAAERLLSGRPHVSTTGELNLTQLAIEAGIPRLWLYRRYEEEAKDFQNQVDARTTPPPPGSPREEHLLQQIETLRNRNSELQDDVRKQKERTQGWKGAAEAAFRIVNLLEKEAYLHSVTIDSLKSEKANLERQLLGRPEPSLDAPAGLRVIRGRPGAPDGT